VAQKVKCDTCRIWDNMAKRRLPPKRPIQTGEAFGDMPFPLQGIDVSTEFELQPPQTTPVGLNVRGYEPGTMRARGGSRPGLSEYVPQQLPSGAHLIQHLNYVVDPQEAALLTGFDPLDGGGQGGVPDPSTNDPSDPFGQRNPGRQVRTGGSGIGLNRHKYTKAKPTPTITPKNITKGQGVAYVFTGTEFTATGLLPGDQIVSVTLTSAGTPAGAAPGDYPIGASLAVGNASFGMHLGMGLYNPPVYLTGTMHIEANTPNFIVLQGVTQGSFVDILHGFVLTSTNYPSLGSPPTLQGYSAWRVIEYLVDGNGVIGSPYVVSSGSIVVQTGMVMGAGNPVSVYKPGLAGPFPPLPKSFKYTVRFEYSPDGMAWPPPPPGF
jgi:hypothetical protein